MWSVISSQSVLQLLHVYLTIFFLIFGSIDTEGKQFIKTGKPYKLIFKPKVNITNTSGLIYFNVADAVKANGQKVILKIQ